MGNFCLSQDKQFNEFSRFFKLYRDYIITEKDLTNKYELKNISNLEIFFNKNRDKIINKMSNINFKD